MNSAKMKHAPHHHNPMLFAQNMGRAAQLWQQVLQQIAASQINGQKMDGSNLLHISQAFMEVMGGLASDPEHLVNLNTTIWKDTMQLMGNASQRFFFNKPHEEPSAKDKRFRDEAWQENPVFDFIKDSYLMGSKWMQDAVKGTEGMDKKSAHKVEFYTRQYVDAMSPSNFIATNPEVQRVTMESNGENLVRGLENMLEDLKRGTIRMTDEKAFAPGKNLALTPGKVVFQNDLMQLIQYEPTTKQVHQRPVMVIPAWINKFYILDLQPENSLVKWLVGQGHTVFMVSWVNPDAKLSQKTFADYVKEGALAGLDAVEKATGEKQVSVIGYCLGGTLLATTLAYLAAKGEDKRVASATYLTTLTDFSEAGDMAVFIDDEQISALEQKMNDKGYLEGKEMATTFAMLRANDLIWSFVVNNYLLGKDPFPFDLLYWNSDATRMPAAMHSFYLRNMYQKNLLIKPGGIIIDGVPIDLRKITTPTYMLSCREDHIAPWQSTYAATQIFSGQVTFTLAASGHIAGVVNPPIKQKYCYWVVDHEGRLPAHTSGWQTKATEHAGSWWSHWNEWQNKYAGKKTPAREIGSGKLKALEAAPGSYVLVK